MFEVFYRIDGILIMMDFTEMPFPSSSELYDTFRVLDGQFNLDGQDISSSVIDLTNDLHSATFGSSKFDSHGSTPAYIYTELCGLDLIQCLSKVLNDVIDVLRTNGEAHGSRRDVLLGELLRRQL